MNKLTASLFMFRGFHPIRWLKDFIIMCKRVVFLVKHGYAEPAQWETYVYFIDIMTEILYNYRYHSMGMPIVISDYKDDDESCERNKKEWHIILDNMLDNLKLMKDDDVIFGGYDADNQGETMIKAKNEFFEQFSKYFYDLWD